MKNFDTSAATNMSRMFQGCGRLEKMALRTLPMSRYKYVKKWEIVKAE